MRSITDKITILNNNKIPFIKSKENLYLGVINVSNISDFYFDLLILEKAI